MIDSDSESDVFARHDNTKYFLKKSQIIKNIPIPYVKEEDYHLRKTHSEWRWRFLTIGTTEVVEISCLKKNSTRKFFDKYGDWIEYTIDPEYNKYETDIYYYYALEEDAA